MSTCHDTTDLQPASTHGTLTIALAGNPNSGKTTIFNALTGLRQKVANYPGVTVEKKTGRCRLDDGTRINVIDLPGTYSLISRSPDEVVAMEVLRGLRKDTPAPDAVIVVVDASNLQRNLYLVSQMIELGRPMVIALNMMDIAERRGLKISPERLAEQLGVPVVPVVGHKHQGITPLKEAIRKACVAPEPDWPLPDAMKAEVAKLSETLRALGTRDEKQETREEAGGKSVATSLVSRLSSDLAERLLIGDNSTDIAGYSQRNPIREHVASAKNRLSTLGIDPMQADIEAHYQWIDEVAAGALVPACEAIGDLTRGLSLKPVVTPGETERAGIPRSREPSGSAAASSSSDSTTIVESQVPGGGAARLSAAPLNYAPAPHLTERVDRILIHKFWGLLIFAVVMATLFISIFWLAQPIMNGIQWCFDHLGDLLGSHMADGPLKDLIVNGVIAGVGTVLVFLPQIALLFFFLAILEDSGYLARAAFLMDRLLSKVGLHGKSFIPLLSSFACAIPGIMATRTIENRKDRLATILVAPFMSCSARLPVYTLLIGTFFARYGAMGQAGIMLSCYVLGIVAAVVTALIFKRTLLKGMPSSFILELPTYKLPQASIVARQVWSNSKQFVVKAGTTIFAMSVILWALAYYPRLPATKAEEIRVIANSSYWQGEYRFYNFLDKNGIGGVILDGGYRTTRQDAKQMFEEKNGVNDLVRGIPDKQLIIDDFDAGADLAQSNAVAAAQSEYSIAGRFGHALQPVIRPLGYDWKMGVGLVAAFAAREVFVSTEGIINATGNTEESGTQSLSAAMQADHYANGKPVWTPLVAVSLLIWFVLAMQCMSTVAIVRRETGGWGWPIFMTVYMNGLAYVVCLIVFQVGSHIGL